MTILPPPITVSLPDGGLDSRYARKLLEDVGASVIITPRCLENLHPVRRWADCGLMEITGSSDEPPQICPVPLPSCADAALVAFRALTMKEVLPTVAGATLLVERAAITGKRRNGSSSPGGQCRLLRTRNGCIGLSLVRDEDWDSLPALLGTAGASDWHLVKSLVETKTSEEIIERGRLLGLAVVDAVSSPSDACNWLQVKRCGAASARPAGTPRVLDLSSLWAGPLCSHLWQAAGAEVVKVEGSRRPDGARAGSSEFFELLNHGKECIALDLHTTVGQRQLLELIKQADIVLEASRPRALRQMGIIAEDVIAANPGLSWVSITGYGRREPEANWVAFGDDAGIAAGLSALAHQASGQWLVCGDAIADPLTGLHAAVAGWASWLAGGGKLIELSLAQTVRHCITATAPADNDYRHRQRRWTRYMHDHQLTVQPPHRRDGGRDRHAS